MQQSNAVDISTLEMLQEVMEDNFNELLETYLADSDSRLQTLANAVEQGNADSVRREAHSLKGSSSNLGAGPMAELCYSMEQRGREENLQGAESLLADIQAEYQQVTQILRSML